MKMSNVSCLNELRKGLVVSCQPVDDGPLDTIEIVEALGKAAVAGGAVGLRIEGVKKLAGIRGKVSVPIIGIVKRDLVDSPVRITPSSYDVIALATAGADIIAFDATDRPRPSSRAELVKAIKDQGKLVMADCSCVADAEYALALGADIIGTTLSGYTAETERPDSAPDFGLLEAFAQMGGFVMAEGRFNTPELAVAAINAGADCVTVGSALTRLEHMVSWFAEPIHSAVRS